MRWLLLYHLTDEEAEAQTGAGIVKWLGFEPGNVIPEWSFWQRGTSGKEPSCQCRRCYRRGFDPWVRKSPWRRAWQPTPIFFPGESHAQRSVEDYRSLQRVGHEGSNLSHNTLGMCMCMVYTHRLKNKHGLRWWIQFSCMFPFFFFFGLWDLRSPTKDPTHTSCNQSRVLTTRFQQNSLIESFFTSQHILVYYLTISKVCFFFDVDHFLRVVIEVVIIYIWMCSVMFDSLKPHGLKPIRLLHLWDFPGKNTGMGCHFLLQGIFQIQGSNLCFLCHLH